MERHLESRRVAALLGALAESATIPTQGRFTLDLARARAVLRTHRLTGKDRYLVALARGLHAYGSLGLVADLNAGRVELGVKHRPLSRREVSQLFSDASFGAGERTRFIAIGLDSALGSEPQECAFESGDRQGAGTRLRVHESSLDVESVTAGLADGLVCRVAARDERSIWSRMFTGGTADAARQQVLAGALRYSRRSVQINNQSYFGGAIEAIICLFGEQWQAAVKLRSDPTALALIHHISDDVVVESEERRDLPPGVEIVLYSDVEPHPMGIEQVRRGPRYEERICQLRRATLRYLTAQDSTRRATTLSDEQSDVQGMSPAASLERRPYLAVARHAERSVEVTAVGPHEVPSSARQAWLRSVLSWAAQQGELELVQALESAWVWPTLSGALASIEVLRTWNEVACVASVPAHLKSSWFGDALFDPTGAHLRALRRVPGLSVIEGRSRLAVAERRAERYRQWRSNRRNPELDRNEYLAVVRLDTATARGEVGMRRIDDVFTRIVIVVQGCALPDLVVRLPGVAFEAIIAVDVELDADLAIAPHDALWSETLALLLQAALECWSSFAQSRERSGHRAEFSAAVFEMLCALREPSRWYAPLEQLKVAGDERVALAHLLCGATQLHLTTARVLALARVECLPRAHGEPVSMLEIELGRRRGEVTPCVLAPEGGRLAGAPSRPGAESLRLEALRAGAGASGSYGLAVGADAPAWNLRDAVLLTPSQRDAISSWWSHSPFVDASEEFASSEARARFEARPRTSLADAALHSVDGPFGSVLESNLLALASPQFAEPSAALLRAFVLDDDVLADATCAIDLREGRFPTVRGRELEAIELPAFAGRFFTVVGAHRHGVRLDPSCRSVQEPTTTSYIRSAIEAAGRCVTQVIRAHGATSSGGEPAERTWVLLCLTDLTRSRGLALAMLHLFRRLPHELAVQEGERILRVYACDSVNAAAWLERASGQDAVLRAHHLSLAIGQDGVGLELEADPWRWWQHCLIRCYGVALTEKWLPGADGKQHSLIELLDEGRDTGTLACARLARIGVDEVAARILLLDEPQEEALARILGLDDLADGDALLRQAAKRAWLSRRSIAARWSDSAMRPLCAVTLAGPGIAGRIWIPRRRPGKTRRARARVSSAGRSLGEIDVPCILDVELDVAVDDFDLDQEDRIDEEVVERLEALAAVRLTALVHCLLDEAAASRLGQDVSQAAMAEAWAIEALIDEELRLPDDERSSLATRILQEKLVLDSAATPISLAAWLGDTDGVTVSYRRGSPAPLTQREGVGHASTSDGSPEARYFVFEDLWDALLAMRARLADDTLPLTNSIASPSPSDREPARILAGGPAQLPVPGADPALMRGELRVANRYEGGRRGVQESASNPSSTRTARSERATRSLRTLLESNTNARSLQGRYERWVEAWLHAAELDAEGSSTARRAMDRVGIEDHRTSLLVRRTEGRLELVRAHPTIAFGLIDAAGAPIWACLTAVALVARHGEPQALDTAAPSRAMSEEERARLAAVTASDSNRERDTTGDHARLDALALSLCAYVEWRRTKPLRSTAEGER